MKPIVAFFVLHLILLILMLFVDDWFLFLSVTVLWFILSHWFGLSVVYHKLFSHRSFVPKPWVPVVGTIINVVSFKGTPQRYAIIHRIHHKHADTELDPHTPKDHWYNGYFGILVPDKILSKFDDVKKRKMMDDLFEDFTWIKHLSPALQLSIIFAFYSILWFTNYNVLVSVLFASLFSAHVGMLINLLGHTGLNSKSSIIDRPLLALLLGPSFNHKYHHENPWDYNEAGPNKFEIQAWAIKNFLSVKSTN